MKKNNFLLLSIVTLLGFSEISLAQQTCIEGFACVQLENGKTALNQTKKMMDDGLVTCELVTIKNFENSNNKSCELAAAELNRKVVQVPVQTECQPEAQIIATVIKTQKNSMMSCLATVSAVKHFNPNGTCPLFIDEIISGIEVGFKSGHDCAYEIGDTISGILVKNKAGIIRLEQ